jgi:TRAP transporter TAXI family solute receptor
MGASTQGSSTFAGTQALQRAVSEHSDTVEISTQETPGSGPANLRLFSQGDIDGGGVDNFAASKAANEEGEFADNPVDELPQQGFYLFNVHLYILTRASTNIETTADLAGSNVWLNPPGTSVRPPTDLVLETAGLLENINSFEMSRDDLPGALEEGRIDAIVGYGVGYNALPGWLTELDARTDFRAVETTEEFNQAIRDSAGVGFEEIEPYDWDQDLGVDTLGTWTMGQQFRFGDHLSPETVYEINRVAHEHYETAREANDTFPDFSDVELLTAAILPDQVVHQGIADYWQEVDVWDDSWEIGSTE